MRFAGGVSLLCGMCRLTRNPPHAGDVPVHRTDPEHVSRRAACRSAIAILERGGCLGSELLAVITSDSGERSYLRRQRRTGFAPETPTQRVLAIVTLQAMLDGRLQ